jgi:hypothetical protein
MVSKDFLHFVSACLELEQEVAVPSLKILKDIRQLSGRFLTAHS